MRMINLKTIGLYIKQPLLLSEINEKCNFIDSFFDKYSNIKFHENPFHADG